MNTKSKKMKSNKMDVEYVDKFFIMQYNLSFHALMDSISLGQDIDLWSEIHESYSRIVLSQYENYEIEIENIANLMNFTNEQKFALLNKTNEKYFLDLFYLVK